MKKKVSITTILDVANFGTMLQAYALAKKIEDYGMNVEFVDYTRPGHAPIDKFRTFCNDKSLGNIIKRVGFGIAALISYSFIRNKTRKFVTSRFALSRKYDSLESIKSNPPLADIYMTGSDQVWNSCYNEGVDSVFFLAFTDKEKVAYAASVGLSEFSAKELSSVKKLLAKYKYLSVREIQTVDYFHQLGFKDTQLVLDPTLLLNAEEWKEIINFKSKKRDPYLLVYSVERFNNDFIFSQAQEIAKARGLKMYVVCTTYPVKAKDYGFDKIFAMAPVEKFISLIADADFIVASSFHGTAFAVNFNKEFVTISAKKYNIRMESFIQQFNISHRIVTTDIIKNEDLLPIDYESINNRMQLEREKSLSYLLKILK